MKILKAITEHGQIASRVTDLPRALAGLPSQQRTRWWAPRRPDSSLSLVADVIPSSPGMGMSVAPLEFPNSGGASPLPTHPACVPAGGGLEEPCDRDPRALPSPLARSCSSDAGEDHNCRPTACCARVPWPNGGAQLKYPGASVFHSTLGGVSVATLTITATRTLRAGSRAAVPTLEFPHERIWADRRRGNSASWESAWSWLRRTGFFIGGDEHLEIFGSLPQYSKHAD